MKANLMFADRDFEINAEPCYGRDTIFADLELKYLLSAMARDDKIILNACWAAIFQPLQSAGEIEYRQNNLRDALHNPDAVRRLYEITVETEKRKKVRGIGCRLLSIQRFFKRSGASENLYRNAYETAKCR